MSDAIKGPWMRSGRTVYALNDRGVNRFFASVQDAHTSEQELEEIARLIAAAPDLLNAVTPFSRLLKEHHQRLSDDQPIYGVGESLITVGDLRRAVNAIAKATGKE